MGSTQLSETLAIAVIRWWNTIILQSNSWKMLYVVTTIKLTQHLTTTRKCCRWCIGPMSFSTQSLYSNFVYFSVRMLLPIRRLL